MSTTNMIRSSESSTPQELRTVVDGRVGLSRHEESTEMKSPLQILKTALTALSAGKSAELMEQFADRFTFNDCALALEFTDKPRLTEFFEKSRELFPDTTLEVVSLFESGDHAIAEWKLAATQTVPYGPISYRIAISLVGSTIAHVENGKIVRWSDYYDQLSSRRLNLAAAFTEWIEY